MSNLFASESRLHVYLSERPKETSELDHLSDNIKQNADRDIVMDFGSVCEFTEQETLTLLTINRLLTQAGHHLTLQSVPPEIQTSFTAFSSAHVFEYIRDKDTQCIPPKV